MKDHKDHSFEFSRVAAPIAKKELTKKLEPMREVDLSLLNAVKRIQMTRKCVANTVEASFEELHSILDECKQGLLEETDRIVQEKLEHLLQQEKCFALASADIQSVIDYTERCVRHCSDNEVMAMQSEVKGRIEQEREESGKSWAVLDPVEEPDVHVEVRCAEALKQLCHANAKVLPSPVDQSRCTANLKVAEKVEVDNLATARLELTVILKNGITTKRNCTVECDLKSLADGRVTRCKVDRVEAGEYSIQYTPTVRGRHEMTISIDGVSIGMKPIPVFVSIHPSQLGKPVQVWNTVKPPNNGTPRSGQTLYNSQTGWNRIASYTCNTFRNSEKRLTLYSEQRPRPQTPNCKTSIIFPPTSGQVKPHPIIIR